MLSSKDDYHFCVLVVMFNYVNFHNLILASRWCTVEVCLSISCTSSDKIHGKSCFCERDDTYLY